MQSGKLAWSLVSARNNELHVGHALKRMDRDAFRERGVTLLSGPPRIDALRAHILEMQKAQRLFFDSTCFSVYLQAVILHLLDKIQTTRKEGSEVRTKLLGVTSLWMAILIFYGTFQRSGNDGTAMHAMLLTAVCLVSTLFWSNPKGNSFLSFFLGHIVLQ